LRHFDRAHVQLPVYAGNGGFSASIVMEETSCQLEAATDGAG
jgi:hypothetical protein